MKKSLLFVFCLSGCLSSEIPAGEPSWSSRCQTSWTLEEVLDKVISEKNIELSSGVKFVKVNETLVPERGRSAKNSVLTCIKRFFTNYELQMKLSDIFQRKQDMMDALHKALTSLNELQGGNAETSRGKGSGFGGGKKGGGAILMMATMMGGTMAALGFGALGMLVMKALTVSAMALLLSAVIGLRRLLRRPDDDAFGRISYIPVHAEHRKRRSFQDLAYRAHVNRR